MNPKKICFVVTVSRTVNMFLLPQFEVLMENGWDVTLACAEDPESPLCFPDGVHYCPMAFTRGISFFNIPLTILRLYRFFKTEQFDIVQYSNPNAAFSASIASRCAGVKVRLYAQWGIRYVGFHGPMRWLVKQIEKITCACSTVIEPDSYGNLKFGIGEGLYPANKGRVIGMGSSCGVDLKKFDLNQKGRWGSEIKEKHSILPETIIIGFLGTMRRDKGANELFQACREIFKNRSDVMLLAVGYKSYFETIDIKLREWFETCPQVLYVSPTQKVEQYMACMDIFTLPSYREGLPTVVIEAEAMGVPVVVSDVPGPVDAMLHGETGFKVPVKNTAALQDALEKLLNNADLRHHYGDQGVIFTRENFERTKFFQKILIDKENLLS